MQAKLIALTAVLLPLGADLTTNYSTEHTLRVQTDTEFSMETTESFVEIDGEQQPDRGRGGMSSEESRSVVTLDTVLAAEAGVPTRVRRVFDSIESSGSMMFGENERELEHDTPLAGLTLELTDEGAKVVEGDEPDDEAVLEGHSMTLALDAFLPEEATEVGTTWTLDGDQMMRAFSLDLERALFVRPERGGERGEGERGGRRGGRGRRGGGGSPSMLFAEGDWTATATLESLNEEHEAGTCAKISLELSCAGEMPEPEFGGGRGGGPREGSVSIPTEGLRPLENSFEVKLEGTLYFLVEERIPVQLEVEGTLASQRTMERSTERGDFFMYNAQEGIFKHTVSISKVESQKSDEE